MKFIHTADLHLDSPLRGLERYEGAPVDVMRQSTRRALENIVVLAVREGVDFVLIAGDIYDGDWRDFNTGLFFARQMARLREARIPVFLIRGNHDAASQITRELSLPDNVHVFSSRTAGTNVLESLGVAVHGQSFPNREVPEDLSRSYPEARAGLFNIGLLHTSADGREGHAAYAPCTLDGLRAKGYDYWALGHVHQREVLSQEPWIIFPGNPQGRHARETGPKSCTLVTADNGRIAQVQTREVDVARWLQCEVTAAGINRPEDLLESVRRLLDKEVSNAEDRVLAVRLLVTGACPAHGRLIAQSEQLMAECRQLANDVGKGRIWMEKIKIETRPLAGAVEPGQGTTPLDDLLRYTRALPENPAELQSLALCLDALSRRLPLELRQGLDSLDLQNPKTLAALVPEAESLLLAKIQNPEVGQ
ncbi:MAG: DNA repair exonuclease [Verrucomicrobiota bacterium]